MGVQSGPIHSSMRDSTGRPLESMPTWTISWLGSGNSQCSREEPSIRTERPMLAKSHSVAVADKAVLGETVRGALTVKALAVAAVVATSNAVKNFMVEGNGLSLTIQKCCARWQDMENLLMAAILGGARADVILKHTSPWIWMAYGIEFLRRIRMTY